MELILIAVFIAINCYILIEYFKKDLGVFQAPFLTAAVSISILLPQITSIYFSEYYDNRLLYNLLFVMITCNLALKFGFELGARKSKPNLIRDIKLLEVKPTIIVLSSIGFIASFLLRGVWMSELEGGSRSNFIVMVNLASYLELGFIYGLVFFTKYSIRDKLIILIVVLASLLYLESIVLLGRRNLTVRLAFNLFFAFSLIRYQSYKYIKIVVFVLFVFGGVINASIEAIRLNISNKSNESIEFVDNFKDSFIQNDFTLGMDLGNAALGIDYCYNNDSYDYGIVIWNNFIYNFVPRFLVGEEIKEGLQVHFNYEKVLPELTKNITTMTGYFDAFASFSYFGFIKFFLVGYILGVFWSWSFISSLYRIVYMLLFTQVSSVSTHSTQYVFIRIEFFLLFCLPFLLYNIYKKKRVSHYKPYSLQLS
ncbi:hypothetical protein [Pedobacter deserti]|uniref:hypothetical protein n=1 Tax=Pedobacter deserti TaxID=2817382 RepID=UPI00210E77AF|nr:hypothetical protein [Pedobacter sp. SYSU D00382]